MKKCSVHTNGLLLAICLALVSSQVLGSSGEDISRIERKFEIRKLAKEDYQRADKRALQAAMSSPTLKDYIQNCIETKRNTFGIGKEFLDSMPESYVERYMRRVRSWEKDCKDHVMQRRSDVVNIIDELRSEFIEEELDHLLDSSREPEKKRKEIEAEIQKFSA